MTSKPAKTIRDGLIKVTIWKNQSENGAYYSVEFTKGYKDNNGDWKETNSFGGTDLLKISHLATRAYDAIAEFRASDDLADKTAA